MRNEEKEISFLIKAILSALKGDKREKKEVSDKLTAVLKKRGKDHLLKELLERLEKRYLKKTKAELIFAREQPPDLIDKVKKKLEAVAGQNRDFEVRIDKKLIGGFQFKTDKILIRASIRDFLEKAKKH